MSDDGSWRGRGRLRSLHPDGTPASAPEPVADLPAAIAAREAADRPRWVWASTADCYPVLLRAGVRVGRCHDIELTEALLLGHAGRWGEPRSLAAGFARLTGAPVPPDPPPRAAEPPGFAQGALFEATSGPPAAAGPVVLDILTRVYADQHRRITAAGRSDVPGHSRVFGASPAAGEVGGSGRSGRFGLLVAAESAGALVGAEMGHAGLPWRGDIHDELLRDLLGPPQPVGPPRRLAELAAEINAAFGMHGLHPDSPAEVLRAFARAGIDIPNTRAWVLRRVDHPAVKPLLEYKELYRIWTAHGWTWRDAWVSDGRFRPEYVPGGVVSGRWATRGGGALQVPKVVRRAVVADPGWRFVVADAGQLEPRVLAAVSGDARLAAAGEADDLYAALAADAFAGDRPKAKVALLGAMYGQTGGAAIPALAVLRQSYPTAFEYVEAAARTGEAGGLVRSWLGRTCPPASTAWRDPGLDPPEEAGSAELPQGGATGRARGRFTRNFVIQATAAEWALVLLATLRTALADMQAEIVLFVHDEVGVHCPKEEADQVVEAIRAAAAQAGRLLFGDTAVRFPLDVSVVECYADAA
ncbi:bifunctional 3'-5' exonuclease/DNA polymerase [Couchioplanes caeruleus subsp. caeruleus]|uniref:DNA-directed DNA polymerase n=1 Tax=Couchioplanes caeruleus subsp. caeruleus TaxID=56427 RepID=A0A1K0FH35_9ACTN|nr:bifunctional 3'-5' exonuclease/DNA polymerase [Couchioplanes caeruleus]OJF12153.1 bifunctional 3'-5' exonuclease/DNA polymerase [Couchioplanes caeruleus subsp. caeruleus]